MIVVVNLPKIQCIYKIYNVLQPEKFYIGSTENLQRRIRGHLNCIDRRKHYNKKLENSFYKYGKDNFKLQILQVCKNVNKQRLLEIEQYWLDTLKPYYNLSIKATCTLPSKEGLKTRADKLRFRSTNKNNLNIKEPNIDYHKASDLYRIRVRYNNIDMYFGGFKMLEEAILHRNNLVNSNTIEELYDIYYSNIQNKLDRKAKKIMEKAEKQKQQETVDAFRKFRKELSPVKNYLYWKKQSDKRTSNYDYVSFSKNRNKYICQFRHLKQNHYLGYFTTELEAANTYNKYVIDNNLNRPLIVIENE